MTRRLFRTEARDRGAVIPIVALLLPVIMIMTAFAVDLGRQRADRRNMQAVADVVALDMSRLADGRTIAEIELGTGGSVPLTPAPVALQEAATRNGVDVAQLTLTWGTFDATADPRFTPMTAPTDVPDAAHIRAVDTTDYQFQPGSGDVAREAIGQLGRVQHAEFLLGSTLVGVDPAQGWFIGQLLSFIIPGADLIGYEGLANAEVTLGDLATSLGVGSVEELADLEITFEDLLLATAEGLSAQGNTVGLAVVDQLLALAISDATIRMGDLLGLDTRDPDAGLVGSVEVPQLLSTGAVLAGGSNFVRLPPSVVNIAGIGTLDVALHIIEGPVRVGTDDLASGTTRQIGADFRLGIDVGGSAPQNICDLSGTERGILGSIVSGLITGVGCILGAVIERTVNAQVTGTIDVGLTVAGVTATQHIDCEADQLRVEYLGQPLVAEVDANLDATVTVAGTPVDLLQVHAPSGPPIVSAEPLPGSATFQATDLGPIHRAFADVATGEPTARIGAPTLGLGGLVSAPNGLRVELAGVNVPTIGNLAKGLVEPMLNTILSDLDQFLVAEVSRLLGLNLGGADITPQWMDCDDDGSVQLVQ